MHKIITMLRDAEKSFLSISIFLIFISILSYWLSIGYIISDVNFIVGALMLPYLCIVQKGNNKVGFYTILAVLSIILSFILPSRTLHFFSLTFSILSFIEMAYGRVNLLPALAIGLMSSLMANFSLVFSFPIRLKISALAAKGLAFIDPTASVSGNIIHFKGTDFSVDTECMGLTMLQISALLALFLIAHFQRETHKKIPPLSIIVILGISFLLNIVFNLLRIVLLILFKWLPNTIMHDAVGLIGLALYVFIPLYFVEKWAFKSHSKAVSNTASFNKNNTFFYIKNIVLCAFSCCLIYFSIFDINDKKPLNKTTNFTIKNLENNRCPKTILPDGIVKYENGEILAYIKPILGFYAAEHSPLICWQGSGFAFGEVKLDTINGLEIYTGTLKKGNDTLQTAWWYDNGITRTASQTTWRASILRGQPNFNLINISANNELVLRENIKKILSTN